MGILALGEGYILLELFWALGTGLLRCVTVEGGLLPLESVVFTVVTSLLLSFEAFAGFALLRILRCILSSSA